MGYGSALPVTSGALVGSYVIGGISLVVIGVALVVGVALWARYGKFRKGKTATEA